MTGEIDRETVAHVARLARLELSDDEIELFTGQLAAVLEYAEAIQQLDTSAVPPMSHPLPLQNVLRADVHVPSLPRSRVLEQAPVVEDDRFRVPRIVGEGT
jgi:aspartyl-tRNA(Asn)/glutamyl-tRNA(Gln) amidotransferase subunit C